MMEERFAIPCGLFQMQMSHVYNLDTLVRTLRTGITLTLESAKVYPEENQLRESTTAPARRAL